jgi:hypothetical protein
VDERTEALRGEALFFAWVLQVTGLSVALSYRLLVSGSSAPAWWDFALAVQSGFWLAAVLFSVRSRWVIHAAVPLGASLAGVCLAAVFTGVRLGIGPGRSVAAGLLSAPLWYVAALWAMSGLRRHIPSDERIETARRQAATVGGVVLAAAMMVLLTGRAVSGRFTECMDLGLLWFLPAALAGWLYRLWGGYTAEAHAAAMRCLPRGLAFMSAFYLLANYLIHRNWAEAARATVLMSIGLVGAVWLMRLRDRNTP